MKVMNGGGKTKNARQRLEQIFINSLREKIDLDEDEKRLRELQEKIETWRLKIDSLRGEVSKLCKILEQAEAISNDLVRKKFMELLHKAAGEIIPHNWLEDVSNNINNAKTELEKIEESIKEKKTFLDQYILAIVGNKLDRTAVEEITRLSRRAQSLIQQISSLREQLDSLSRTIDEWLGLWECKLKHEFKKVKEDGGYVVLRCVICGYRKIERECKHPGWRPVEDNRDKEHECVVCGKREPHDFYPVAPGKLKCSKCGFEKQQYQTW